MNQKLMKRKMAKKEEGLHEIDLTSLMDIMVILLVFLLKSYNPTDLAVDLSKDINIPSSSSFDLGENSVIIKMDKQKRIFVDDKEMKNKSEIVGYLKVKMTELVKLKKSYKKKENVYVLNLVMDEGLTYQDFKGIMDQAAEAGYNQYKFIVKGKA